MKEHFIGLFNYDRYTNLQILESIFAAQQPAKPVQLMAHLLAAQQIWFKRCNSLPAPGGPIWPDWPADSFKSTIEQNHADWLNYLQGTSESDFETPVAYTNTKGEHFKDRLSDVIAHVINHGTHHRAQIGVELKLAGLNKLPVTDYIFYTRESKA